MLSPLLFSQQSESNDSTKVNTPFNYDERKVVKVNEYAVFDFPINQKIEFKKPLLKIGDLIDMSLPELLNQYVYTNDEGVPYLIQTDKEGNIIRKSKHQTIIVQQSGKQVLVTKPTETNPEEKIKEVIKTRPAYYYTATYHNSRLGENLRVMDIVDMSLEELKKLEVIIGGQSYVNLISPSGNTIIITEEELNTQGYKTITQVLNNLSSVQIFENDYLANGTFRGFASDFSDVLILINGREFNSLYSNNPILGQQFGTANVKQLEISLGPGEIDYPYNAYSGVINIITKDLKDSDFNAEIQTELASPNHTGINMVFGKKVDKFQINGNARFVNSTLYNEDIDLFLRDDTKFAPGAPLHANGINNEDNFYKNTKRALNYNVHANFKDIYFGSNYYLNKVGNKGMSDIALNYNNANYEQNNLLKAYTGYDYIFGSNGNLNVEYDYTQEKIQGVNRTYLNNLEAFSLQSDSIISNETVYEDYSEYYSQEETHGSQRHTAKISLFNVFDVKTTNKILKGDFTFTLGYQFDHNDILGLNTSDKLPFKDFDLTVSDDNPLRHSRYAYMTHQAYTLLRKSFFNELFFVSVGAKYKYHQYYKGKLLLKARTSMKLAEKTYLKFGYSEGIYDPFVSQLQITDNNSWQFNYQLKPSTLKTINAGVSSAIKEFLTLNGNFFYNIYENYLVENINGWSNNNANISNYGIESNAKFTYDDFSLNAAYTYINSPDNTLNFAKHKTVIIANYNAHDYVGINVVFNYSSKVNTLSPFNNTIIEIPKRYCIDLNYTSREVKVGKTTFIFVGSIKNLTDTEIYFPNSRNYGPTMFLARGRYVSGKLIVKL